MTGNEESIFNMGIATMETLRFILNDAHAYCINGDALGWFSRLNAVYKEVLPFIKKAKQKDGETLYNQAIEMRKQIFNKINDEEIPKGQIPMDLYYMIDSFEIFLRERMKDCKMFPAKDDFDVWR